MSKPKSRAAFGLPEDRTVYICPQSLFKFHPDFDATLAGILRLDGNGTIALLEDRHGALWLGTWGGGVWRYTDGQFEHFSSAEGLVSNWIISLCEDADGRLWFGSYGGGASIYDGRVFRHFSRKNFLNSNSIQQIYQDRRGTVWIATDGPAYVIHDYEIASDGLLTPDMFAAACRTPLPR